MLTRKEFYVKLCHAQDIKALERALLVLWYEGEFGQKKALTVSEVASIMKATGLGNPNVTILRKKLQRSRQTINEKNCLTLKPTAKTALSPQIKQLIGSSLPVVDLDTGFLPSEIWKDTRDYIERIAEQINGCHQYGFYDAAAVMIRRLIETLLIETYEHLKRQSEIQDADNNYFMLDEIISRATSQKGLNLSRETKKHLPSVKKLGDLSSHSRRFNAKRPDLDKIAFGVRVIVEDLIGLSALKH